MEIRGKIPPIYIQNVNAGTLKASQQPIAQKQPAAQDRVELSSQAREIQSARKAIDRMPEVDAAKVSEIKARLQNGTYTVDGRHAAARMLEESLLKDI